MSDGRRGQSGPVLVRLRRLALSVALVVCLAPFQLLSGAGAISAASGPTVAVIFCDPPFASVGEPIACIAVVAGGVPPYTVTWDVDDDGGIDGTGFTLTATFLSPGERLIRVTVTDSLGASTSGFLNVAIAPPPLLLTKTATDLNGGVVEPGDRIVYTLELFNLSFFDFPDVVVTDALDPNIELAAASGGCSFDGGSRTVSCLVGMLAVGVRVTRTIDVTVLAPLAMGTIISNQAFVTSRELRQPLLSDDPTTPAPLDPTVVVTSADIVPPKTIAVVSPAPNAAGWNRTLVTVRLAAADNDGGSGVREVTYRAEGAETIEPATVSGESAELAIGAEGETTVSYFATDKAGNVERERKLVVRVDRTPPTISGSRSPGPNEHGWNNTDVTASFACADALSGLLVCASPTTLTSEGREQAVTGVAEDVASNTAEATVGGINIDKTAPTVSCTVTPATLWPPNHELVEVTATVEVSDALSGPLGFSLLSAMSNEPDAGPGIFSNDIQGFEGGTADVSGKLRAERLGEGTGRMYTLAYSGLDRAFNWAVRATHVAVPRDLRQR